MTHILDNPAWSALNTGNRGIAKGIGKCKFYRFDIAPFAGLEENTPDNLLLLHDLNADIKADFGIVSTKEIDIPVPWKVVHCVPIFQMVCEQPKFDRDMTASLVDLSDEHIPQMMSLAQLTNPGPFRQRTIEFGYYRGIFDGEQLVAMAGQRMYAPPYAEISAVCTHPRYTGRGYAAQLMLNQIRRISSSGEIPFLHVAASNERAIKIYESFNFVKRKYMFFYLIRN